MILLDKKIKFMISYGDSFLMSRYQYYIAGAFYTKPNGKEFAVGDNIIDNFLLYLFLKIEVKKHNHLIEEFDQPGITSSIRANALYKYTELNSLTNCGYISEFEGNINKFRFYDFLMIEIPK